MDPITQQTVLAAAGAAGGDPVYVDDVFSTFLWEGDGGYNQSPPAAAVTVNNGIDLSGEGGLVWLKNREDAYSHWLFDTERGGANSLKTNLSSAQADGTSTNKDLVFNSTGFVIGEDDSGGGFNQRGQDHVSWTFRKAPGFFDVVTYSGTGSARTIAHNLGSVPGMIIVKVTSGGTDDWFVYHRSLGDQRIKLNSTNASGSTAVWNYTAPTSSVFSVGTDGGVNGSGRTYVAYIFAHDDAQFGTDEDESIIKCGSYTGTGSPFDIDIGFEAQWVMYKKTNTDDNWYIIDNMRGFTAQGIDSRSLKANLTDAENGSGNYPAPYAKGFRVITGSQNQSGHSYIYMAIRRPHKPPETGTDVFHAYYGTPASNSTITTGFPFDMQIAKEASSASSHRLLTRKLGLNTWDTTSSLTRSLQPGGEDEAQNGNLSRSVGNTGFGMASAYAANLMMFHSFKSAAGFMDVVGYEGNGSSNRAVDHNLTITPELLLVKRRSSSDAWRIQYTGVFGTGTGLELPANAAKQNQSAFSGTSAATASSFYLGTDSSANASGNRYVAYLFGTLAGISKVGTYSGTGNNLNVDCGFTAGARFILIKQTNGTGDWYVWDYARGIVSGNDPYYKLNVNAAQVTNTDYIDPLNAGFTVTSSAPAWINENGGNYLFLAIS